MIIGAASGIIAGILLEHCGVRKTGCVALSTTLAYTAILVTWHHPKDFNGDLFPILILLFLFVGNYTERKFMFTSNIILLFIDLLIYFYQVSCFLLTSCSSFTVFEKKNT